MLDVLGSVGVGGYGTNDANIHPAADGASDLGAASVDGGTDVVDAE